MKTKIVIYVIAGVVLGAFFIANWALLSSPVPLNLLFASVETPLAIVLLLLAGVVLAVDFTVHALAEHAWRVDRRKLMMARVTAEQNALHIQDLRPSMEREFAAIRAQLDRVLTGVQRLANDTMEVASLTSPAPGSAPAHGPAPAQPPEAEPELIPPRSGDSGRRH